MRSAIRPAANTAAANPKNVKYRNTIHASSASSRVNTMKMFVAQAPGLLEEERAARLLHLLFQLGDHGVIRALMDPHALDGLPSVRDWLQHVEPAWQHVDEVERNAGELTRHTALTHANVLAQLENLRTHDYIQQAEAESRLLVHGWYYDILSGRIEQYDEKMRKFLPLAE